MHLDELETKMKHNSLEPSSSSSCDATVNGDHSFNDRGDAEIANIEREMRDSMLRRESLLDEFCESLADKRSSFSGPAAPPSAAFKKLEPTQQSAAVKASATGNNHNYSKFNGNGSVKPAIDPKKKTKLLAALKHIENDSSSFEN